jgi:hypothetical protein
MGKNILSIYDIKLNTRFVIVIKISQRDIVLDRTYKIQVLGRVNAPCLTPDPLELVQLCPIVAPHVKDPIPWISCKISKPIQVFSIDRTRATHIEVILKHQRGFDEVIELEMMTHGAQDHSQWVHIFLLNWRIFELIRERLRTQVKAGHGTPLTTREALIRHIVLKILTLLTV